MGIKIPIETSARHIHLSEKDFKILFGENAVMTAQKELSQPGQYLTGERVSVIGPKSTFEKMAVLGPFRKESQVEISVTDARKLGIPAVIRQSGDIAGTPGCILQGPEGSLELKQGVIVAKRHIHMTPSDAIRLHVKDNESVFVLTKSYERALIYADVIVRVHKDFRLAMHVDTDESNAFANDKEPYGVIIKLLEDMGSYDIDQWMDDILNGIYR